MTVSMTWRAWKVKPPSPAWSISCERTTTMGAPSSFFSSLLGVRLSSSSSAKSTRPGIRAAIALPARSRSGRRVVLDSSTELAAFSTTSKLLDAPGHERGHADGVMLGSTPIAGRIDTSAPAGRRSASSAPISYRIASTRK